MYNNSFRICTLNVILPHKKRNLCGEIFFADFDFFHAVVVFYLQGMGYDVLFNSIHSTDLANKSFSKI